MGRAGEERMKNRQWTIFDTVERVGAGKYGCGRKENEEQGDIVLWAREPLRPKGRR